MSKKAKKAYLAEIRKRYSNATKAAKEKGEELKPSFMSSVLSTLDELGVPRNHIKKESYG